MLIIGSKYDPPYPTEARRASASQTRRRAIPYDALFRRVRIHINGKAGFLFQLYAEEQEERLFGLGRDVSDLSEWKGSDEMTTPTILTSPPVNTKYKPNAAKKRGEALRIELLGTMQDRFEEALTAGNKAALLELAAEYVLLGCPTRANQIAMDAEGL